MDADQRARAERKRQLLLELAELQVEELVEAGVFDETPHLGRLERIGHELGKEVGREVHKRTTREAAARCDTRVACPTCGTRWEVTTKRRTIESIDGPVELSEPVADCDRCRRSFFPSASSAGDR